jgi:hypothetical protein
MCGSNAVYRTARTRTGCRATPTIHPALSVPWTSPPQGSSPISKADNVLVHFTRKPSGEWEHIKKAGKYSKMSSLKGQCHEIFCFWFFSWVSFPSAPEYPIRTVSNFFENLRRYSQVKVHHRYQRHWWQNMETISGCRLVKVNLKAKIYMCVNSTTQRCPNKIIKIFLIEDFFRLPPGAANISAKSRNSKWP